MFIFNHLLLFRYLNFVILKLVTFFINLSNSTSGSSVRYINAKNIRNVNTANTVPNLKRHCWFGSNRHVGNIAPISNLQSLGQFMKSSPLIASHIPFLLHTFFHIHHLNHLFNFLFLEIISK